jgi:YARHG domain
MVRKILALLFLLGMTNSLPAQNRVPPANICLGEAESALGCTEDTGRPLDEAKLLRLGCEPLSVIRNAIFEKYGLCLKDDFNQQFFNQTCSPTGKNSDAADDKVEVWSGILTIVKVERLRGCYR